eukprot:6210735-Pleurochrysis_carterae.AAC.1
MKNEPKRERGERAMRHGGKRGRENERGEEQERTGIMAEEEERDTVCVGTRETHEVPSCLQETSVQGGGHPFQVRCIALKEPALIGAPSQEVFVLKHVDETSVLR